MRLAYATIYDARGTDRGFSSYNSAAYHLGKALADAGAQLDYLGPLRETFGPYYWAKQLFHRTVGRRTYNRHREKPAIKDFGRQLAAKAMRGDCDIVFSPISVGSQPVAHLECEQPIVICTDGTLASAVKNYPSLSWDAAVQSNLRAGLKNEADALARARMIFYPSHWAANSAISQYRLDPSKVRVVPWGANLDCRRTFNDIQWMVESRSPQVYRLLFVGMDWERKGGPTVVAAAQELRQRGLEVELDIVGTNPFRSAPPPFARVHGRLRRSDPHERHRFDDLFARAHVLFVPSRADAFGHVFAEAASFGVPSITTDVDGIPSAVRNGVNGMTFGVETPASCYADAIDGLIRDRNRYRKMAFSSFAEFETRLNWRTAARSLVESMNELIQVRRRLPSAARGKAA